MATRKKPDFSMEIPALWVDRAAIPREERNFLAIDLAKSSLSGRDHEDGQKALFLRLATFLAQEPHDDKALQKEHDQLNQLGASARRLLQSLNNLNLQSTEGMSVFAREVAFDQPPSIDGDIAEQVKSRDGFSGFLEQVWDQVHAVEVVAERTRAGLQLSKTPQKVVRTGAVVSRLALYHWQLTDKWPSSDAAGWFGGFAAKLGEVMGLEIGPTVLKSGIAAAKKESGSIANVTSRVGDLPTPVDAAAARARELQCDHEWPQPLLPRVPQNCAKCGGGMNGAPDRLPIADDVDR